MDCRVAAKLEPSESQWVGRAADCRHPIRPPVPMDSRAPTGQIDLRLCPDCLLARRVHHWSNLTESVPSPLAPLREVGILSGISELLLGDKSYHTWWPETTNIISYKPLGWLGNSADLGGLTHASGASEGQLGSSVDLGGGLSHVAWLAGWRLV